MKRTVAAKPKLVQITTAYSKPAEGSAVVPRSQYVEIRQEKPKNKYQQEAPEYKTCKFVTQAIVADGTDKGEFRKVCANPDCPVHHPKKQQRRSNTDAAMKAAQEKQRREDAQAQATGRRVLKAIGDAIPVRLMKRDLLFVAEQLLPLMDEKRLEMVARNRSIKAKEGESVVKLLGAFVRKADEGTIGKLVVEAVILLTARTQADGGKTLRVAAQIYGIDTDAVALKVKQEFNAKDKARKAAMLEPKPPSKPEAKTVKKTAA